MIVPTVLQYKAMRLVVRLPITDILAVPRCPKAFLLNLDTRITVFKSDDNMNGQRAHDWDLTFTANETARKERRRPTFEEQRRSSFESGSVPMVLRDARKRSMRGDQSI